jgi:hypothetical protein
VSLALIRCRVGRGGVGEEPAADAAGGKNPWQGLRILFPLAAGLSLVALEINCRVAHLGPGLERHLNCDGDAFCARTLLLNTCSCSSQRFGFVLGILSRDPKRGLSFEGDFFFDAGFVIEKISLIKALGGCYFSLILAI